MTSLQKDEAATAEVSVFLHLQCKHVPIRSKWSQYLYGERYYCRISSK